MGKPIIAIDVDDVIASSTEALRLLVNERQGVALEPAHYQISGEYWGYYERVWSEHGVKVSYKDMQSEMAIDQSHIPLLPGVSFAIAELTKHFDIAVVTARDLEWEAATLAWLEKHFGDVFVGVHFAGNKYLAAAKTKGELCKEVGATLLIDDNVDHCKSAVDAGLEAVLFGDYGWQQTIPDTVVRCRDWPAVLEYVNGNV